MQNLLKSFVGITNLIDNHVVHSLDEFIKSYDARTEDLIGQT